MPDIEYAFLADFAQVQPGQKFNVLGGGVTRINGPSLPFTHPHLSLVLGLRLTSAERNREHELAFIVSAPDGSQVTTAGGRMIAHGPPDPGDVILTMSIDFWSVVLAAAGEYSVRIVVDGNERRRIPLQIAVNPREAVPEQRYLA
jgi:hypothetical protein